MTLLESIFLGFVQGVTEFLPVSSSGHLAIFKHIFGLSDIGIAFDVFLHVGTLIAVIAVYYKDVWQLIVNFIEMVRDCIKNIIIFFKNVARGEAPWKDFSRKRENDGQDYGSDAKIPYVKVISSTYKRFVLLIIISTIPTGIFGLIFSDWVETLSLSLLIPGICLLINGVFMLLAEALPQGNKTVKEVTYKDSFLVGLAQIAGTFPGISRSGSTISAAMMTGYKRSFAVKYSFIMSLPVVLGAAIKNLGDIGESTGESGGIGLLLLGMAVAAVVGFFAIKVLDTLVKKDKFRYFSYYCFIVGIFAIVGSIFV